MCEPTDPNGAGLPQNKPEPRVEIPLAKGEGSAAVPVAATADSSAPHLYPTSPITPSDSSRTFAFANAPRHPCDLPPSPSFAAQSHARTQSPALSIFERSVQEDIMPHQSSPSIPSHIRTENYIPPVLEASSEAITDEHASPEPIEIITPSIHQSSATDPSTSQFLSSSWAEENPIDSLDCGKTHPPCGAPDNSDIRRLSFISFADVINAENAETAEQLYNRDLFHLPGGSDGPALHNRSPSPVQSPTFSSALGTSPPTSVSASLRGMESSLPRGGGSAGSPSPTALSPPFSNLGGDIDAERTRQVSKEARSTDMSKVRSPTFSPAENDEIHGD